MNHTIDIGAASWRVHVSATGATARRTTGVAHIGIERAPREDDESLLARLRGFVERFEWLIGNSAAVRKLVETTPASRMN